MIAAYEGDQPYIFVSYAHKDSREVFDLIEKLSARGYRIWYDEGIEPGTEWPENIANHLLKADMVLAMITNDSMESVNCRREINFALSKNKPFLSIILEKTDIPAGMELQLSSQQSVLRYNYKDEERFLDKIESCSSMDICKGQPGQNVSRDSDGSHSYRTLLDRKDPKIFIAAGLGLVLVALVIFIVIPKKSTSSGPSGGTQSVAVSTDSSDTSKANAAKTESTVTATDAKTESTTDTGSANATTDSNADSADVTADSKVDSADTSTDSNADKAEADTSSAPTESTAAQSGNADPRWIYSVSEDDENLIYTFSSGPVIVMPISWKHRIKPMEQDNDVFVFYHEESNFYWGVDGYENAGDLFALCFSPTQDYKNMPSYSDLGRSSEGYFYLMFPTDLQAYSGKDYVMQDYLEMSNELSYVKQNSKFVLK